MFVEGLLLSLDKICDYGGNHVLLSNMSKCNNRTCGEVVVQVLMISIVGGVQPTHGPSGLQILANISN
jgi:hypothetical protein